MPITRHPFHCEADISRILDLVLRIPFSCRHVIDLPWRLSSPAINEGRDAAFWEDSDGQIVGFAAWQYYWAVLDFFLLPGHEAQSVEVDLFAWADRRFHERDEERGQPLSYWVEFRDDDRERQQVIERHGFLDEGGDRYVLLQHELATLPPVPTLLDGFTLRPLAGEQEVAAYTEIHRAAFESMSMTPEWRARTLRMPTYRPELDLVISAPDGSLAGFCVGWFDPTRNIAQIEPIGVHPHFHKLGLGRILLLEMLHRFKDHGANSAIVETNVDRTPARHSYESVGFKQIHTIPCRGKWLHPIV